MDISWMYMVICTDASYYIGITNDVGRRVWEHNKGIDRHCYTFTRRPVKLVYCADFSDPNRAIAWEKQLKGWSRKKKQALIAANFEAIRQMSSE